MAIIKTVNAEGGSDARYDVSQMSPQEAQNFDGEGRPLGVGFPDQDTWTQGLPGARGGDSQYSMGGGGGGGGGGLMSDPYFAQLQSQMLASSAADRADTQAALRTLLIQFGLVPQNFNDSMGALDDTTRALIQKNTDTGISQYARLLEGKGDVQRATIAQLAGSGLSRSGAKGYKLRRGQLDFDRGLSDAISSVQQKANEGQSGFASRERDRQSQLAALLAQLSQTWKGQSQSYKPPALPQVQAPQAPDPETYWNSNPAPTYTNPATGTNWYGGFGGLESTKFPGKAGY